MVGRELESTPPEMLEIFEIRPAFPPFSLFDVVGKQSAQPQCVVAEMSPDDPEAGSLNKRVSNRKLRTELKVDLRYPTIDTGLPDALRS